MGMSMMSGLARQRCPWADSTDLNSIPGRETRARGFAPTPNFASSVFNVCVHNVFNVYSVWVWVWVWVWVGVFYFQYRTRTSTWGSQRSL